MTIVKPSGLINSGSSCWLNSLVQMMLSSRIFMAACAKITIREDDTPLMREFADIAKNRGTHFRSAALLLSQLKRAIVQSGNVFNVINAQECVHEAYSHMIEMLNRKEIAKMFFQARRIEMCCKLCGEKSHSRDFAFYQFIPKGAKIPNMVRRETVANYRCEACKCNADAVRNEYFTTGGEILLFLFPKYMGKYSVPAPMQLQIPAKSGGYYNYELCSFVEHYGDPNSGHYCAFGRRGNQWYQFNDLAISPIQKKFIEVRCKSSNVYMVLYERV